MPDPKILQLAYELEWLGCELEYYGQKHALQGFPNTGEAWAIFLEKQRGVLSTAEKIQRELKDVVRFNPQSLVGVEFPLKETLESISELMAAVEDIKLTAVHTVQELPSKVRAFTRMVNGYLETTGSIAG
ncbi:MAG TPA: hypothetical protein VFM21_05400 [Terriglobia bacterium]|nr:hypothetical protein [Terriglobia bacterium]